MPSGMELMASNLLKALGLDPEKLTAEFKTRIEQFEAGIAALNSALSQINTRLDRIEATQAEILTLLRGIAASGTDARKSNGAASTDAGNSHAIE